MSAAEFTPRLTHTDLSYGNLIMDPSTGRLNGVIDWGNTKVGDPAREFMGAFGMSRTLGEKALSNYGLDKTGFRNAYADRDLIAAMGHASYYRNTAGEFVALINGRYYSSHVFKAFNEAKTFELIPRGYLKMMKEDILVCKISF